MPLGGQALRQVAAGNVAGWTGGGGIISDGTRGHTQRRVLVRFVLDGGGATIQLAVTEPALHDTLAGGSAGELARGAGGGGAARRLV